PGWDRFLTERDREVLRRSGREKTTPFGLGNRPALMLIDLYYAALGFERVDITEAVEQLPTACGQQGWEAVDRAAKLLDEARRCGVPVIHVGLLRGFPSPWAREERNGFAAFSEAVQSRAFELVEEVRPIAGELVVDKAAPSAFQGTPLQFH